MIKEQNLNSTFSIQIIFQESEKQDDPSVMSTISVDLNPMSPVVTSGLTRQVDIVEMKISEHRKTSIIDELSLNVDKKPANGTFEYRQSIQDVDTTHPVDKKLTTIQSVDVENHNVEPENDTPETKIVDSSENVENGSDVFSERRLVERQSLFIVHNEVQSASCVEFYFECSNSTFAILEFFVHLVRLQIVEYIKQVMSLGYVVICDIRKVGDNHGMRIVVQSQYPLTVVYSTIENAISSLEECLSTMSEETFERNRSSVSTNKREASLGRMRDVANLLWLEITESTYNFRRTEKEIKEIENTSADEIIEFYRNKISVDGDERRLVVISIGPDAILNRLDDSKIRHWTFDDIVEFRETSTTLRRNRVPVDRMNSWYQNVFDAKNGDFDPPQVLD
jgi:hypothetical protein